MSTATTPKTINVVGSFRFLFLVYDRCRFEISIRLDRLKRHHREIEQQTTTTTTTTIQNRNGFDGVDKKTPSLALTNEDGDLGTDEFDGLKIERK